MTDLNYPIPANEEDRLEALDSYDLLDTMPENDFEELTHLASQICKTSIALISLIDDKRQWFKSIVGYNANETPREMAFCAHTIMNDDILVVPDARQDDRFKDNPLVTGDPSIVFYAGVPLTNEDGFALGSLCVIDRDRKELSREQIKSLKILGKQVMTQMELRRKLTRLEKTNASLLETNSFIQKFASTAAHDLKNPLSSILLTSQALQMRLSRSPDEKTRSLTEMNITSTKKLLSMVDEMLQYSSQPGKLLTNTTCVDLNTLLRGVVSMIEVPYGFTINLPTVDHTLTCSAVAIEQIFMNLLTNAIRYNDKEQGVVNIQFREDGDNFHFKVSDNGMGIAEKNFEKIFHKEVTLNVIDRYNSRGTGIGLYTVKALIKKMGGHITVSSRIGSGTTFEFSVKKNVDLDDEDLQN